MTPQRWEQVKALFSAALGQPPEVRHDFVREATAPDTEVRAEADRILAEYERAGNFLEDPILPQPKRGPERKRTFAEGDVVSDRYVIERFIAHGGMGEVYCATDRELSTTVALKTLRAEADLTPAALARFKREVLARRVNDPHVCQIFDFGRHRARDGTEVPYLTMEYLEGETLYQRIRRAGPFEAPRALPIVLDMIQALSAAHRRGIIHRDLKPGNVMLVPDGAATIAKVMDFGLARGLATRSSDDSTAAGYVVGTPAYMAPEQFKGQASEASDIYALGIVMHEMVTGVRPFRPNAPGCSDLSIVADRKPELDPQWRTAISKCLEVEPANRFQTVEQLRAALTHDEAIPTVSLDQRSNLTNRRRLLWLASVIAALAIVAAIISYINWPAPRERKLVVIPFTDLDKSGVNQPFCEGLTETLVSELTQLEQPQGSLLIIPTADVKQQKVTSAAEARNAFGANLVLTGTVQRSPDGLRLIANLIDAGQGRQIRSRIIRVPQNDAVSMQDAVITQIAGLLDVSVPAQAKAAFDGGLTTNPRAYDYYLEGYGYLRRYGDINDAEHAIEEFNRALSLDSRFGLAYSGLAEAYWRKYELTQDRHWIDQAWSQAQRARELNSDLPALQVTLGLLYSGKGQYDKAETEYEQALRKEPGNPDALVGLARAQEAAHRFEDAEKTYKRAIDARPGYWNGYVRLGSFYIRRARYNEAIGPFRRVVELTPDNPRGYYNLGALYHELGRDREAEQELKRSLAIKPTATAYSNLAALYLFEHRYKDAVPILEKVVTPGSTSYVMWGNLGDAYRYSLGMGEKALHAYREAIRLARNAISVNPKAVETRSALATYLAKSGDRRAALTAANEVLRLAPDDSQVLFDVALTYELSGKRQEAVTALTQAIEAGFSGNDILKDPDLRDLRSDPRVVPLLAK